MPLLPASHSRAVPRTGGRGGSLLCKGKSRLEDLALQLYSRVQPQSPPATQVSALCRSTALHAFSPGLQAAHAPPDSSCHWLLPVANPRDWRRHAPPLLLLLLLLAQHAAAWPQARVLSRMLRAVVGDAASGHKVAVPRCVSTRPWQRHRSPAPQKFSGRRTDCDPALSSAWRTGGVVVEAGVCRGPGWLGGDFQGTASLTRTRRNSSGACHSCKVC